MDDEILIPNNMIELQEFTAVLWDKIFDNDETNLIQTYNLAAKKYNEQAGWEALITIHNLNQIKMATKKKVAKKTVKSAVEKTLEKVKKVGAPSQKTQVVELANEGFTMDEIIEKTGIKKANVQWYFSKLKLGKK